MKYLHDFCRKKPAGIFGTFLFSIRILQQLLCQQYKCRHFLTFQTSTKNYLHNFCRKSCQAFSDIFCSSFCFFAIAFMYLRFLLFNDMNCWHFWPYKINKRNIYTNFAKKSRPAFSDLFSSPFGFCNSFYVNNMNAGILSLSNFKKWYQHNFCKKKASRHFRIFSYLLPVFLQLLLCI